jgi:putative cell wall-binding protein
VRNARFQRIPRKWPTRLTRAVLSFALLGFLLSGPSAEASIAGVWQNPLATWDVDGYYFGEYVSYMNKYHLGDDVSALPGTPVMAPANGTVVGLYNFNSAYNYGGIGVIEHTDSSGAKVVSVHGHLDGNTFQVQEGQEVVRGQLIGYIGDETTNGGWVPHIHAGVHKGPHDPDNWNYWGYGSTAMMAEWENPTQYIAARKNIIEVARIPATSPDRYTTAAGVSQRRFMQPGSAKVVYIASGTAFADALAGTPLTKAGNGPLLLSKLAEAPPATVAEIQRVLPAGGTVTLLGGEKSVGPQVVTQLTSLGFVVNRLAGTNREMTATILAGQLPGANTAFLVNKDTFPDAVSASGPASESGSALLLTAQNKLSDSTAAFLSSHPNISNVHIIGGAAAVDPAIEQELIKIPSIKNIQRVAGSDRYGTNIQVAQIFGKSAQRLIFATGSDYPDALTGGSLVAPEKGVVLLSKSSAFTPSTKTFIEGIRNNLTLGLVVGGSTAVDPNFDVSLASLLNAPITNPIATPPPSTASINTSTFGASTWSGASMQTLSGITLPVPTGFETEAKQFRGASVAAVLPEQWSDELAPPLVLSRVTKNGTLTEAVADWFGTAPEKVELQEEETDQYVLTGMLPGFFETTTSIIDEGSTFLIVETRTDESGRHAILDLLTK